jgi:tRNA uridine 5-carbamoylmethylation protein Kti12
VETTYINFFGEPSAGKSTISAGIFYLMKRKRISCELTTEYAKDLIYDGQDSGKMDQIEVFTEQRKRLARLNGKVEYVITDSPLALSAYYAHYSASHGDKTSEALCTVIIRESQKFNNLNFFVNRTHEYEIAGRTQSEEEAIIMKEDLRAFLKNQGISYKDIHSGDELPNWMMHGLFTTKELMK